MKTFKTTICGLEKDSKSRFSLFSSTATQNIPFELILKTRIARLGLKRGGGGGRGGRDSLIKVGTDVLARPLGFSGVNFWLFFTKNV